MCSQRQEYEDAGTNEGKRPAWLIRQFTGPKKKQERERQEREKERLEREGKERQLRKELEETRERRVRGMILSPEKSDNALASSLVSNVSGSGRESPPASDPFQEFVDYSFGQQDNQPELDGEEGSKAHTPELVSSSTNLSPESNTDGENSLLATIATSVSDVKKEDHQDLRLGLWKEFDGGESAYYQPFEWKWDSPMPVLEQSWAVSTS